MHNSLLGIQAWGITGFGFSSKYTQNEGNIFDFAYNIFTNYVYVVMFQDKNMYDKWMVYLFFLFCRLEESMARELL